MWLVRWGASVLLLGGLLALSVGRAPESRADPPQFYCAWDASCPEISVLGDPPATIGGGPAPYRGYGDPSLEYDPSTGALWMSYSWLDVLVSDPGPPPVVDFGVRTHLARSDDGGQTFTFVRSVNATQAIAHPDSGAPGWAIHEVSTLVRRDSGWEALWLTYFDPEGPPPPGTDHRTDPYYARSLATAADDLGDASEAWASGYATSPSFGVAHDLSEIPELSDCAALTEPALLSHDSETYLATACVVVVDGVRRYDLERIVLLREAGASYEYLGELLGYQDALDNGGTRLEQADLAVAENGAVLLIATPIQDALPNHLGCVVFEVADLGAAQVRRDVAGKAEVLMRITGEDDTIGPGLCTYDAASATGVVMVLHDYTESPLDIVFSMRVTGLHPQGLDSDGDGLADTADNCPAWPNAGQQLPPWAVPPGDDDCDGWPSTAGAPGKAPESFLGTGPQAACAATGAANDEPLPDAWPVDFDDNQLVDGADVLKFGIPFLSPAPGPPYSGRFDFNGDGFINGADVLQFGAFFLKRCSPYGRDVEEA